MAIIAKGYGIERLTSHRILTGWNASIILYDGEAPFATLEIENPHVPDEFTLICLVEQICEAITDRKLELRALSRPAEDQR